HGETHTTIRANAHFTSEFGMVRWDHRAKGHQEILFIRPILRSDLICIRLKIFSSSAKTASAL
ncbi:hypothetical protein ACVXHB_16000, partial [Escherichia coli]